MKNLFFICLSILLMSSSCESKKKIDQTSITTEEMKEDLTARDENLIKVHMATVQETVPGIQSNLRSFKTYAITISGQKNDFEKGNVFIVAEGYKLPVKRLANSKDAGKVIIKGTRNFYISKEENPTGRKAVEEIKYDKISENMKGKAYLIIMGTNREMKSETVELTELPSFHAP